MFSGRVWGRGRDIRYWGLLIADFGFWILGIVDRGLGSFPSKFCLMKFGEG
jgi:hypothetical protein